MVHGVPDTAIVISCLIDSDTRISQIFHHHFIMSRKEKKTPSDDISDSSDNEKAPAALPRPASRADRPGRPLGTGQVVYEDAEKVIAFQLLMRECPKKPSGKAFLAELKKDLPSRSTTALQTFMSKIMRKSFPKIFRSVYKNDWSLLSAKQTRFVCLYMEQDKKFLSTRNCSGAVNQGASTSSGKTTKRKMDFRPLPLKYSTPKLKKSECSSSAWPDLSPVETNEEEIKRIANTVAQSVIQKLIFNKNKSVTLEEYEKGSAESDEDDGKGKEFVDGSEDEMGDINHGVGGSEDVKGDVELVEDSAETDDSEVSVSYSAEIDDGEVSDKGDTAYAEKGIKIKDENSEDGSSRSVGKTDEDVKKIVQNIELDEDDIQTARILLQSSSDPPQMSKESDEGIQLTSSNGSTYNPGPLRARISTINLIDIFPKGYKGRDSPFVVNIEKGHVKIQHTSDMLSDCSTDVAINYSGHDNSAVDSITKLDAVSSADLALPLTPMEIVPKKGGESKFQKMTLTLPGNVKVPVLVKIADGVQFLEEEED